MSETKKIIEIPDFSKSEKLSFDSKTIELLSDGFNQMFSAMNMLIAEGIKSGEIATKKYNIETGEDVVE